MRKILVPALVGLCGSAASAADVSPSAFTAPPGLYRITTETVLPHLEESLRYATTLTERCLGTQEASSLFPLLRHEAFTGCGLAEGRVEQGQSVYRLACANPEAASGAAKLAVDGATLVGVLEVKMGGKNMTLSQRVRGPRLGACAE